MPIVKVTDLAYVRLQSPSLDEAEAFLTTFGLVRSERTRAALYMRGTDEAHHLHVSHVGPSRFLGLAFHAASEDDLRRFATVDNASGIEHLDEPGGGLRVRIADPNGYTIELVHGLQTLPALPVARLTLNDGADKLRRAGTPLRVARQPSQVKRIAHAVLMMPNARAKIRWYREMLGLLPSDEIYAGTPDNHVASFDRCDRGAQFVDHHTLLCFESPKVGLNHVSFEVQSFDDLMVGHEQLRGAGYRHVWGIGRHLLGSQIFDYWEDPWGRVHEHWTDSDVLNASSPANPPYPIEIGLSNQWGGPPPQSFVEHATP